MKKGLRICYGYKYTEMTPEIIIPPPLAFRNTSVFVKCNPNNIDFKKELQRVLKYKNVKSYDVYVYSVFGHAHPKTGLINGQPAKGKIIKPFKDINSIKFHRIETQYLGYRKGLDRCGVEVFYLRAGRKGKDGKTLQYVTVKNNGERDYTFVGIKELKQACKDNGIKGYSKCKKDELVKLLMKV